MAEAFIIEEAEERVILVGVSVQEGDDTNDSLAAKISRITNVLSITLQSKISSIFRSCAGDSSSSQTIPVAWNSAIISLISCSFPVPT